MRKLACKKNGRTIEMDKDLARDGNCKESRGTLATLFCKYIFRNMSTADDDGFPDDYEFTEFGDERLEEISMYLEARIK